MKRFPLFLFSPSFVASVMILITLTSITRALEASPPAPSPKAQAWLEALERENTSFSARQRLQSIRELLEIYDTENEKTLGHWDELHNMMATSAAIPSELRDTQIFEGLSLLSPIHGQFNQALPRGLRSATIYALAEGTIDRRRYDRQSTWHVLLQDSDRLRYEIHTIPRKALESFSQWPEIQKQLTQLHPKPSVNTTQGLPSIPLSMSLEEGTTQSWSPVKIELIAAITLLVIASVILTTQSKRQKRLRISEGGMT